ncbi:hypothetical protein [Blastococcus sp. CT_GayMR16]|uniref:hypothetical protein n=1 Tax=Blastococcus sp. CT_GayMR16 TaxID=2559607 RepID=UPI001073B00F|nr:hypothetical protein [Blastococcus sp. CT_GayMR16]TFV90390.1 hypothetical protein E4P38_02820 [Blastococcus sp. CT_GayMR16]
MSSPLFRPTSLLVCSAWLRLASGVRVDTKLPDTVDEALRTDGFIRIGGALGGDPGLEVPMRNPVVFVECWVAPNPGGQGDPQETAWLTADQIAARLLEATWDRQLQGVDVDLSTFGNYAPARVHDVIALTEPERVEEEKSDFARVDIDLAFTWTQGA